jgi:hypothetical protein
LRCRAGTSPSRRRRSPPARWSRAESASRLDERHPVVGLGVAPRSPRARSRRPRDSRRRRRARHVERLRSARAARRDRRRGRAWGPGRLHVRRASGPSSRRTRRRGTACPRRTSPARLIGNFPVEMAITKGRESLSAKAPACMARANSSLGFSALDVAQQRLHERAQVVERPAAVAGRAPPIGTHARAHRRLVVVPVGAMPPRVHDVVRVDLRRGDAAIAGGVPLRRHVRARRRERLLRQAAHTGAARVSRPSGAALLKVVPLVAAPPHRARRGRVDLGRS